MLFYQRARRLFFFFFFNTLAVFCKTLLSALASVSRLEALHGLLLGHETKKKGFNSLAFCPPSRPASLLSPSSFPSLRPPLPSLPSVFLHSSPRPGSWRGSGGCSACRRASGFSRAPAADGFLPWPRRCHRRLRDTGSRGRLSRLSTFTACPDRLSRGGGILCRSPRRLLPLYVSSLSQKGRKRKNKLAN